MESVEYKPSIEMPSMSRKIRRKLYMFVFAVMYAFIFFEAGILYQDKYSRMRLEAEQQNVQESKELHRKELVSDFHHEPNIVLQSVIKGEVNNDTSFAIEKTTSSLKSLKRILPFNTDGSDFLVF